MDLTRRLDKHLQSIREDNTYVDTIAKDIKENIEKYFKYKIRIKDIETHLYEGNPSHFTISIGSNSLEEITFIEVYVYPKYLDIELSIELPTNITGSNRTHDIIKNYKINYSSIKDIRFKLVSLLSKAIVEIWSSIVDTESLYTDIEKFKMDRQYSSWMAMPKKVIKELAKIDYRIGNYYFTCINESTCEKDMYLVYKNTKGTYPQFIIRLPSEKKRKIILNGKILSKWGSDEYSYPEPYNDRKIYVYCDDGKPSSGIRAPRDLSPEERNRFYDRTTRPYIETFMVPFNNWPLQKLLNQIPKIVKDIVQDFIFDFNEKLINRINNHLLSIKEDDNWKIFMDLVNGFSPFKIKTSKGSEMGVESCTPYRVEICNAQIANYCSRKFIKDSIYPRIIISFPGDWTYKNSRNSKTIKIIKVEAPNKLVNIANIPFDPDTNVLYRENDYRIKEIHSKIYSKIIPIIQKLIDKDSRFEDSSIGKLKAKTSIKNMINNMDYEIARVSKEFLQLIFSPLEKGVTYEDYIKFLKNISNRDLLIIGKNMVEDYIKGVYDGFDIPDTEEELLEELEGWISTDDLRGDENEIYNILRDEVYNWDKLSFSQVRKTRELTYDRLNDLLWDNRKEIINACKEYLE